MCIRDRFVHRARNVIELCARSGRNASTNHRKALYPLFTDQHASDLFATHRDWHSDLPLDSPSHQIYTPRAKCKSLIDCSEASGALLKSQFPSFVSVINRNLFLYSRTFTRNAWQDLACSPPGIDGLCCLCKDGPCMTASVIKN